ncbi:MAG: hypothetical protein ACXVA9_10095 [Bdellovibrionales bacterium]
MVSTTWAAPFPGTSSSPLVSEKPGAFYSTKGFRINSAQTAWIQSAPPKHIPSLVTVYKSPSPFNGQQPALTVRVDDMRHTQPLKTYVKKWMKDYTRFGFEVLTAKPIKIGENQAFLLDIVSRETQKQLRQVVFVREKTAVILTCRDGRDSFAKTVQDCNEIVKTFEWVNATQ